jgi:hypothetical protein
LSLLKIAHFPTKVCVISILKGPNNDFRFADISILRQPYEKGIEATRAYYKVIFKTEPKTVCPIFDKCLQRIAGIYVGDTEIQAAIANLKMAMRHYQEDAQVRTLASNKVFNDLIGPLAQGMASLKLNDGETCRSQMYLHHERSPGGAASNTKEAMPTLTDLCRRRRLSDAGNSTRSDTEVGLGDEDMSSEEVTSEDEVRFIDEEAWTASRKRRQILGSDITFNATRQRRRRIVKK